MYHRALRNGVIAAGILLVCSLGCQTETHHNTPGALPAGLTDNDSPRLNASTYFAHAHLLERQGNFAQAAQQYRRAIELSPDFVSAHNRLGITLNKLGQHAEATARFREAIRLDPGKAYLHNNLGFSLYLERRYEEAAEVLEQAVELQPEFHRARMNYAIVLAHLGQYDQALAEFRLATSEADAHYNMAVVYTDLGKYADAARALETALRFNPDFEAARAHLRIVAQLAAEAENMLPAQPQPQPPVVAQSEPPADEQQYVSATPQDSVTQTESRHPLTIARTVDKWPGRKRVSPPAPIHTQVFDETKIRLMLHALVAAAKNDSQDQYAQIRYELDQYLNEVQVGK